MTPHQNLSILMLHKCRVENSETFAEFKRHQIELLNILITDQSSKAELDTALQRFLSYDDTPPETSA